MKKYKVNVNGTAYEVEIEEMTGAPTVAAAPVAASAAGNCLPLGGPRAPPPPPLPARARASPPPCPATFWPSTWPPATW